MGRDRAARELDTHDFERVPAVFVDYGGCACRACTAELVAQNVPRRHMRSAPYEVAFWLIVFERHFDFQMAAVRVVADEIGTFDARDSVDCVSRH